MANTPVQRLTLQQLEQRVSQLPLLPNMVMQLMQLDPAADDYFDRVVELLRSDPAFVVRLLNFANSAALAPASPVASLEQALMLVGCGGAVRLVLGHSAIQIFLPRHPWEKDLWRHAFDVALLAETLAPFVVDAFVDPHSAYLAGLLHDIGRFVLYLQAPDELRRVDETGWGSPQALIDAEIRLCGYTHAELGFLALRKWRLAEPLPEIVRHHHDPLPIRADLAPSDATLISLLHDADWLSMKLSMRSSCWSSMGTEQIAAMLAPPQVGTHLSLARTAQVELVRAALASSHAQQLAMGLSG
jgi:putative nucleotidyltransferase with HDIG domain